MIESDHNLKVSKRAPGPGRGGYFMICARMNKHGKPDTVPIPLASADFIVIHYHSPLSSPHCPQPRHNLESLSGYLQSRNRDRDTENKYMHTKGKRG